MWDAIKRRDLRLFIYAAAINALLFAIALALLSLRYESNDDAAMMRIASGLVTGTPSQEIIFSNVLIGCVLQHLYEWNEAINWYTLYLIGAHFLAMTGLLYAFLRVHASRLAVILFVLLFVQFEPGLLLRLQFTSTAVVVGAAGLLLVATSRIHDGARSRLAAGYGGGIIVLSGAIRVESLFYAIVLLFPALVFELSRRRRWKVAVEIIAFVGLALAALLFNGHHYQADRGWADFVEYNAARGALHDLPMVKYDDNTQFFFDRIGWSYVDWGMFTNWFFTDRDVFSSKRLHAVLDRFRSGSWGRSAPLQYRDESLRPFGTFSSMLYANLLLACLLGRGARGLVLFIGLTECLLGEGVLAWFAWYAKLPPRLILPAYAAISAAIFFVLLRTVSERRDVLSFRRAIPYSRPVLAAGGLAFCAFYGWTGYGTAANHVGLSCQNQREAKVFRKLGQTMLTRYVARDPNAVFLNWGGQFPVHWCSPFDNLREYRRIAMVDLGWSTGSPDFEEALRRRGISDLCRATYENPSLYFFTSGTYIKQLKQYVLEHDRQSIRLKRGDTYLVDGDSNSVYGFTVFQMGRDVPEPTAPAESTAPLDPAENLK